ncbi:MULTISPECIES: tautomerase family protein [Mycolicibacterium]|uniref:Tautomerase yrdN n=1 Tax=Mycolicibacterium senegalense TaxID=1796 RepID=A0A378W7V6_9MYCO|nr:MULTISPECIES: tautomerase family protein [Mycolicibacterium]MCV7337419.1 tautomerase family protein [Mycolicibacterium senegalense]MDR7287942.1 phenylpyruvate tautomerase PptA (4-oxalocrotonate tautomerase family) [Mycolicibacterium senegalense]QZA24942.1 tautomerase family protein [Mycolicibacterium senegalense]CDP86623.1 malonate semialdehyde decarboxylase [Mycolicibacterium farcinogenes]SUA28482.1 tautomerase yrdN [Mycolicibacterium senegalense]
MPLVHIHVIEGRRTPAQLRQVADTIQDVMLEYFAAPERDRYQIITEHKPGQIIAEDTGLGFDRTDDIVLVHVFQQGRTSDQKQETYRALAQRLREQTGLKPADLIVSMVENSRADWSFGDGRAQFIEGLL